MTSSKAELRPQPRPGILDIAAYVPGKSGAKGKKVHKLSSNELPLGASPAAVAAFRDAAGKLELYPDGSATALREAIAARYGLNPDAIVCGAGSDELLQLIAHAYLGPGDEAIYSEFGFLVYPIAIKSNGATAVVAPERNHTADVDAILARVTPRTRIVFLANPNNPTGTLSALQRGEAPSCRPAARRAAGSGRGLCRICPPQRLRVGHRAGVDVEQCHHDAHLLQDSRACGTPPGLGLLPRCMWPMC